MLVPRRSFLTLLFATALFATAFSHSPVQASGMYQLTDLGIASVGYTVPIINASGQVIQDPTGGGSLMSDGTYSIRNPENQPPNGNTQTNLYQNGSLIATVNTFIGGPAYQEILGYAVNKSGMVVGSEQTGLMAGPLGVAFYYTVGGGIHAVPLPYSTPNSLNAALSVNDAGLIVGTASGPNGYSYDQPMRAYLSNGQTSWDLNTLIAPGSGLTLISATYINDSGQIAGLAIDSKNQEHIFLLTPTATPEPSVLMILGAGILAIGAPKATRFVRKQKGTSQGG